ncbi:MAG: helix-turn-helix transcriptional regulator [Candidatus Eremiobacteraeota bacterium]|nr:helix-turn-helix transcriptional regulator [Candidatus Eremiobacteraeota bacterium]MBV8221851.1 helix-turn-helix transcriptional regulator [Candidatus Eremiobacteraeota bacterium]
MTRILFEGTALTRTALADALPADGSIVLLDGARSSATLARDARERADVLVLEAEGDEVPAELLAHVDVAGTPVLLLVSQLDGAWARAALRAGARAVVPRDAADLGAAVAAVASGYVVLHPDAVEPLVPAVDGPHERNGHSLTAREIEVLRMMAEGLANKAIAARLGISEHTVKFHVGSIFAKLHAGSRTEAVTVGARQGLVML